MANVIDYIRWRGDLSLEASPFCDADALVLAELTFIDYAGIVPERLLGGSVSLSEAAKKFFSINTESKLSLGEFVPSEITELFRAASQSVRFRDAELCAYRNQVDTEAGVQFSAVSFLLPDNTVYIGFRGTDDSIVGWQENFRMSFRSPVPAQERAAEYLSRIGGEYPGGVRIGGHSKGGNLAVWAGFHAGPEVRDRIVAIYNLDGPGFAGDVTLAESYLSVRDKIRTIVPECSVVGMFLDHDERYHTVKSTKKGLLQHDGMSWEVLGTSFVEVDDLTPEFKRVNSLLSDWIKDMDDAQRESFTEAFFKILYSTKATTLTELAADKPQLLRAISSAEPETRHALAAGFRLLIGESRRSVNEWFRQPRSNKTI